MAGAADTGGLKTVLGLLGASGHVDGADGEAEADLFEAPAPLPLPLARPEPTGQRGRPKGARNKSTDEWVRFHLSRYRSPLTGLAELHSRPLEQMVDELQRIADKHKRWKPDPRFDAGGYWERVLVDPMEVLKLQKDCYVALLPYLHKRQPIEVEVDQRRPGVVVIGNLEMSLTGDPDDLALPLPPLLQNQQVTDLQPQVSDGDKSETVADQTHEPQ